LTPRVPPEAVAGRRARGQTPQPAGAIVSGSGDIPTDHPYFTTASAEWRRVVYTASHRAHVLERPGVEVVVLDGPVIDLRLVLDDLHRRGFNRVVCEGGPKLNRPLFALGLVDELFLTIAPRIDAGCNPLTLVVGDQLEPIKLELRSVYERDGELFLRYGVAR
jgi:2,5-diamino-6-(ribosylamino)-4(3H)-pyrimidinone 5'-phosphate reductase